jgi:hypothetical protein
MTALRLPALAALGSLILSMASATGQAPAKLDLLAVSKGQLPTDIGSDDKTKPETVDSKELNGKAMKVVFSPGDSIGVRPGEAKNWKQYTTFRVNIFNPSQNPVSLELVVIHARSTNYQTRAVTPIKLKAGLNQVKIGIDEMANVNGSAPDLAHVTKWYISDPDKKGPTLYFSDIWLEGGSAAAPAAGGPVVGLPAMSPNIGYRIKGKVGGLDVDVTITPFVISPGSETPTTPATEIPIHGDPARLTRIKAAKMPKIDKVIEFTTPEADAICSALEVFPPNNPWNLLVDEWPLHPNSKNIIASIGENKKFRYNDDMGFIIVPPDFKKTDLKIVAYPGESDKGPFPIPDNIPIEGWPSNYTRGKNAGKVTLDDVQRDKLKENGDRHALVLDPTNRMLYEFYQMKKTDAGWQAACTAIFDLKSNKMRPDGWTSTDAAGLPIYPAVVRHDELQRGLVEHALRVTVVNTRRAYVYPATHFASSKTNENLPRMGERIRLRKDFDVSGFSPEMKAILNGLKRYGMFVADNGIDWAISVAPDPRIKLSADEFGKVKGSDFEVVTPPPGFTPPE